MTHLMHHCVGGQLVPSVDIGTSVVWRRPQLGIGVDFVCEYTVFMQCMASGTVHALRGPTNSPLSVRLLARFRFGCSSVVDGVTEFDNF